MELLQNFYLSPRALNPNHTPNSTHTSLLHLPEVSCPEKALCLDQVGGAEGQLLHLSKVISGVLIGHNTTDSDDLMREHSTEAISITTYTSNQYVTTKLPAHFSLSLSLSLSPWATS